jgi:AAA family ATP:ADP antiporter
VVARDHRAAAFAATLCAGSLLAHQVAANATRDALFLSSFDVTDLPRMVVVAAVFSVIVVFATSRLLVKLSPARFVPAAFVLSAAALIGEWAIARRAPHIASVVFYLHTIAFGSVLTSGFWSLVNERFDPRSAKKLIGRIASGGTLGAVAGGLCAERVGAFADLETMFFVLAALHLLCAYLVRGVEGDRRPPPAKSEEAAPSGLAVLMASNYLKQIALLVLLVTVSATLLDYVLKSRASEAYASGEDLMRFFAAYYAGLGFVSFVVQSTASAKALDKLGLGKTAAMLPAFVIAGTAVAMVFPSLVGAAVARAADRVTRTSLYRSAYELLYTPIPPAVKRATKSIIDVLCDRLGDAVGGAVISVVLALVATRAEHVLLIVVAVMAAVALVVAIRLQRGYVDALERSLVALGPNVAQAAAGPRTQALARVMQRTEHLIFDREQGTFYPREPEQLLAGLSLSMDIGASRLGTLARTLAPDVVTIDPVQARAEMFSSRDAQQVKAALKSSTLEEPLIERVTELLAWDDVLPQALKALCRTVDRDLDVHAKALLDPETDFTIRRRLPRVLAAAKDPRAARCLLDALADPRFEVRYQVGRALSRLSKAGMAVEPARVIAAVRHEASLGKEVWASQRVIDERPEGEADLTDRILEDRANRSMEHVFRLLSLVLPREPLEVAFAGLTDADQEIRGTALEYLDSVLPEDLRADLWPFLDDEAQWSPTAGRSRESIVDELMKSRPSILTRLEDLE